MIMNIVSLIPMLMAVVEIVVVMARPDDLDGSSFYDGIDWKGFN